MQIRFGKPTAVRVVHRRVDLRLRQARKDDAGSDPRLRTRAGACVEQRGRKPGSDRAAHPVQALGAFDEVRPDGAGSQRRVARRDQVRQIENGREIEPRALDAARREAEVDGDVTVAGEASMGDHRPALHAGGVPAAADGRRRGDLQSVEARNPQAPQLRGGAVAEHRVWAHRGQCVGPGADLERCGLDCGKRKWFGHAAHDAAPTPCEAGCAHAVVLARALSTAVE